MVPNLIWKQVASGRGSKFENLIEVKQMGVVGCECPDANGVSSLQRFGQVSIKMSLFKKVNYLWTTLLMMVL